MGTIYRNGVPFVGSGGAGGVEMTQAEYDLLPTSEKMNGAIYFITDGDVSYPTASQMRYDNTESQIPSTTVQGAIDENRIEINDLKSDLTSLFKHKVITGTTDSAGNIPITGVSAANNFVVSVVSIGGYPSGLVTSSNVLYTKIMTNNDPVTPAINTSVTLYVTYI